MSSIIDIAGALGPDTVDRRLAEGPRLYKPHAKREKFTGLDWDALRPTCKGCQQKSGRVNDTGLCPECRGETPEPVAKPESAPGKRAQRRRSEEQAYRAPDEGEPEIEDDLAGGEWVLRNGVQVWQAR